MRPAREVTTKVVIGDAKCDLKELTKVLGTLERLHFELSMTKSIFVPSPEILDFVCQNANSVDLQEFCGGLVPDLENMTFSKCDHVMIRYNGKLPSFPKIRSMIVASKYYDWKLPDEMSARIEHLGMLYMKPKLMKRHNILAKFSNLESLCVRCIGVKDLGFLQQFELPVNALSIVIKSDENPGFLIPRNLRFASKLNVARFRLDFVGFDATVRINLSGMNQNFETLGIYGAKKLVLHNPDRKSTNNIWRFKTDSADPQNWKVLFPKLEDLYTNAVQLPSAAENNYPESLETLVIKGKFETILE